MKCRVYVVTHVLNRQETAMNVRDVSLNLTEALLKTATQETTEKKPFAEKPPLSVAISREVGALGSAIAVELGKRLGWPVYDQELIDKIAEEIHRPSFHVRSVDEKP